MAENALTISVREAGKRLGIGRDASYAAAKRGDIPTIKLGRLVRVPIKALDKVLEIPKKTVDHK